MVSDYEFNELINDEVLQNHKKLLKTLAMDSRVVCICKDNNNNNFYLQECCDDYFAHILMKNECIELSELFKDISEKL